MPTLVAPVAKAFVGKKAAEAGAKPAKMILALFCALTLLIPVCFAIGVAAVVGAISAAVQQTQDTACGPGNGAAPLGAGGAPTAASQTGYARTIIGIAKGMDIPVRGQIVAIATALQESGLRNLANPIVPTTLGMPHDGLGYDHFSVGVFQQQTGGFGSSWGTPSQVMDPKFSAWAFYRALLQVRGWETMPVTVAAQTVQRSGTPAAYAKWEGQATSMVQANQDAPLLATNGPKYGAPANGPPNAMGAAGPTGCGSGIGDTSGIAAAAERLDKMNLPYVWGGGHTGTPATPSGSGPMGGPGLDCSGAVSWVLQQAGTSIATLPAPPMPPNTSISNMPAVPMPPANLVRDDASAGLVTQQLGMAIPATMVSGGFMGFGEASTLGASAVAPPNGVYLYAGVNHVFMSINGRVFSSSTDKTRDGGPHWRTYGPNKEWEAGMVVRHVPGT